MVETSPQSLNVTSNKPFTLTCTVKAEFGINTTIHITHSSNNTAGMEAVLKHFPESQYCSGYYSSTLDTPAVLEYLVEGLTESGKVIYRCGATALNTTTFSDTTIVVMKVVAGIYKFNAYINYYGTLQFQI